MDSRSRTARSYNRGSDCGCQRNAVCVLRCKAALDLGDGQTGHAFVTWMPHYAAHTTCRRQYDRARLLSIRLQGAPVTALRIQRGRDVR
jgi:hypothetical protein